MALKGKFIYMGSRNWTKENGKILTFAKLGNVEKMENYEFLIDPKTVDINSLTINSSIEPEFELSLYNGRPNLNLVNILPTK